MILGSRGTADCHLDLRFPGTAPRVSGGIGPER